MVLLMHVLYLLPGHSLQEATPTALYSILSRGWLGVDLFFVLSGLLITGILLDTRNSPNFFRVFYARRALRILPLYFTVATVLWFFYTGYASFFVVCYAFLANFASWFRVPAPHPGSVFWSLAVEEHFYLIWPLLAYVLSRKLLAAVAITIVVLTPLGRAWMASTGAVVESTIYVWSWFRFDTLALGALLAIWIRCDYARRKHPLFMSGVLMGCALAVTLIGIPFGLLQPRSLASASFRYTQVGLFLRESSRP
jgi:peptidoglycan/LPS O-acetylase OafA/YrhL